jgi:hypothetical protein
MAALLRTDPEALGKLGRKVGGRRVLKVGFFKGEYPDDGPMIAAVAAWNEFGVAKHNQPPRPFFRRMIVEQSGKWPKMAAMLLKANGCDIDATLDILGQEIQGRVQESIRALTEPPLSPVTIAKKGHDKPLIETALMVNSVNYQVVEE